MSLTPSTMLSLGTEAPDFSLPDINGDMISLEDFKNSKALTIIFMCNHCPYVKHIREELAKMANDYEGESAAFVGINANDTEQQPEDRPEKMAEMVREYHIPFPYLFDESQEVAKKYRAACTPDIFVFDEERRLVYRGQFDDSRPGNDVPVTGRDLREAVDAVLEGRSVSANQKPSMGCNIKWKPGNEPDYFG